MKNTINFKVLCIQLKTKVVKILPKKYRNRMVNRIAKDMLEVTKILKNEYERLNI